MSSLVEMLCALVFCAAIAFTWVATTVQCKPTGHYTVHAGRMVQTCK